VRGERCRTQWLSHVFAAYFATIKGKNGICKAVALCGRCMQSIRALMAGPLPTFHLGEAISLGEFVAIDEDHEDELSLPDCLPAGFAVGLASEKAAQVSNQTPEDAMESHDEIGFPTTLCRWDVNPHWHAVVEVSRLYQQSGFGSDMNPDPPNHNLMHTVKEDPAEHFSTVHGCP
jgi:hypothetical protein